MTASPDTTLVFVNERPVHLPRGAAAADAVRALDPALADRLVAGAARLTDGRGLDLPPDAPVGPGDIIRVVVSARRPAPHADA